VLMLLSVIRQTQLVIRQT